VGGLIAVERHVKPEMRIVLDHRRHPHLHGAPASGLARGAYVLADASESAPEVILIATGSEVSKALEAHEQPTKEGIRRPVVSTRCWVRLEAFRRDHRRRPIRRLGARARPHARVASPPRTSSRRRRGTETDRFLMKMPMARVVERDDLRHASSAGPQYVIKSVKTDHVAIRKGEALRQVQATKR
jgi:hypothetical protein